MNISTKSSVSGVFFLRDSSIVSISLDFKFAPFVKSPDLSVLPTPNSFFTPSHPILSILSKALKAVSFCILSFIFNLLNNCSVIFLDDIFII